MNIHEIKAQIKEHAKIFKEHEALDRLSINQVNAFEEQLRQKMWGQECPKCKRIMDGGDAVPTVDHIIPEMVCNWFGLDSRRVLWVDNLWVLCKRCNNFKANRLDFTIKETKVLLQKLLDNV